MSFRLPINRRKSPSAMGLRQILPVQTKRTLFTRIRAALAAYWEGMVVERQVNACHSRPRELQLHSLVLARGKKANVRGDFKRSWMSDEYFDLIVWYERSNA